MKAGDATNRIRIAFNVGMFWFDRAAQKRQWNRLFWERMRGVAFHGWEPIIAPR